MRLSIVSIGLAIALAMTTNGHALDRKREAECRKIDEQIRNIQSRMRHGYSAAQGVRYEERLRALKERRWRRCR
ncbi:MAG: hypothetical protein V2I25_06980 [Woeseiaceae bacterium]|jgi:hypothetical protein|nr:hypothetical protein [Woeseiaceae bacterium]